ncbi:Gldg family protein [Gammaproteobacteria bacterium]|nr:Gldg family protein [Gammaproteobacteria bacterium]MDC1426205.1 Gldg family protein [Gammaproteobacteria bacterium]
MTKIKFLFSGTGLLTVAIALLISVGLISALPSLRIDLTEDDLFSLADGTRNIVSGLEEPIELLFFYSESATEDQPQIRSYGTRVQELLREIVIASGGNLVLSIVDPEPFSEEEDLATQYGVQPVPVTQGGQGIYFGLVAVELDNEKDPALRVSETMPLIRPDQEQFLEYEFMQLVTRVANPDLKVVGLLTTLDIDGGFDPMTGQATQQWMITDYIRQLYDLRRIETDTEIIEEDVDILMIVHPEGLSEQTLYAIDQHVMRGGETFVFLDPTADSMVSRSERGSMIPAGMRSDLPGLLEAWGVDYASDKVLTDNTLALRVQMGQGSRPVAHIGMIGANRTALAGDDIITRRLENLNLSSVGALAPRDGATTRFEPLIQSSSDAMLMNASLLEDVLDPSVLFDEFVSTNERYTIAARVSGVISSAFPEGRPVSGNAAADTSEEEIEADDDNDSGEARIEKASSDSDTMEAHLSQTSGETNILLFADTDVLTDRLWVQVAQFMGQRIPQPYANNGDFVINALDNLSGGADLVSIRSRGRYSRPFERVVKLQREADDRLRTEEAALLARLAETEEQLAALNTGEGGQLLGQLTPEIQTEIDRFNAELLDTRRSLRDVQFQLTADIEALGSNLKWFNTAAIPMLLTVIALFMSLTRARRRRELAAR